MVKASFLYNSKLPINNNANNVLRNTISKEGRFILITNKGTTLQKITNKFNAQKQFSFFKLQFLKIMVSIKVDN